MRWRVPAFIAFVIGGIVTLTVFRVLGTLGHMEAGMSAGAVQGAAFTDTLIPWIAVSYFAVSAIGILIARKRNTMRLTAALAHLMLLVTFCLFCLEASRGDEGEFLLNVVKLAVITAVFFSPWIAIWCWLLFRHGK